MAVTRCAPLHDSGGCTLLAFKSRFPHEGAYLHGIFGVVDLARLFLRGPMFRVHAPRTHAILVFEFDDSHSLTVVGEKAFM
jgi:hypothetical protein